jgi:hypothetical protein
MALMDAPEFDSKKEILKSRLQIGFSLLAVTLVILTLVGFLTGHGWAFSNLPIEARVNRFFTALEAKDYGEAYAIYTNDPAWKQHPERHATYDLQRFTEDWTTDSPVNAPIVSHHVDISRTDGTGAFGTGIIVAVRVNGNHKIFMYYTRADRQLTWPAPHILQY